MSIGIDFILKANSDSFIRALGRANNAVTDVKKGLRSFDVGNGLKQALGVGGVIAAFRMAITHAQELRDRLEDLGKPVDDATRSVARYGDALDGLKKGTQDLATATLSFITRSGEGWGMLINRIRGISAAEERMREDSARGADKQEAARDEALKKRDQKEAERRRLKERDEEDAAKKRARDEEDAEKRVRSGVEKAREDIKEEERKWNRDQDEKHQKAEDALREKFAPSVEQLAAMEVGGFSDVNDPRLVAKRILETERRASILGGRGDIEGAVNLGREARSMREGLQNVAGSGTALTAETAESALRNALDTTNKELQGVREQLKGIIKAQN